MSIYSDPNQDIIYHIMNLLPTVEEALLNMKKQLEELRLEEGAELYGDITEAVGKIAHSFTLLKNIEEVKFHRLDSLTAALQKSMSRMNEAYEEKSIIALQEILTEHLIPTFFDWWQELNDSLRSFILL